MTPRALVDRWQAEAELLRRRGAPAQAEALESVARELAEALEANDLEELTVAQAAAESGYSESQIRRLFGGRSITRGALPRKAAHANGGLT